MADYTQPTDTLTIAFQDASGEISNVSVNIDQIDAANFDANLAAAQTGVASLVAAIRNVTLCNPYASSLSISRINYNMGFPTDEWAQRELGLQVGLRDTVTGKKSHFTIPGPDWAALKGTGDFVDTSNVQWVALVAKIESVVKSPEGNPVAVVYGKLAGRRN